METTTMTTKQIMEQYEKEFPARDNKAELMARVMTLLNQYRDLHLALAPQLTAIENIKKEIAGLVLECGQGISVEGASASIRSGYTRVTWDGKMLDGFALVHPEIAGARKESEVKPTVVIKVEK